jgi:bifunctional UDP-N-acetylglucosamine pyrophosphorylase/glucosamine-1-phosphate N-acetyltransferase
LAAVVLAAGQSTRMNSKISKVLHPIGGVPLLGHVLKTVASLGAENTVVVSGPAQAEVTALAHSFGAETVIQDPPLGTGHAVLQAKSALADFCQRETAGDIVVIFGDTPLITPATLRRMIARRRQSDDPAVVVYGFRPADAALYGRLIVDAGDHLLRIVEARDADAEELSVGLCNGGVVVVDADAAFDLLAAIGDDNAKGEYYLTDIVSAAVETGRLCAVVVGGTEEIMGVDDRAALATAETILQDRLRVAAMEQGVSLSDPNTIYLSVDTKLGRDVTIEPNVIIGPGVNIGDGVVIKGFSHIEGATIQAGAVVGPFARLRPGTELAEGARVGNFVEVKNTVIEAGAKVNHLSYIGDARVGEGANVGAGTITCNYDGFSKSHTDIGAGAFIGSNTALVAPVKIGDGAIVGAGSVITDDVGADAIAITRSPQLQVAGGADRLRHRKRAEKEARLKSQQGEE